MNTKQLFLALICFCATLNQPIFSQELNANYIYPDSIQSKVMNETRNFWVKLPKNYNPNSDETYPVVFILDGDVLMSTLTAVYNNYWGHYMPHMIMVGISNSTNRTRDLTTSKITNRRGGPVNVNTGGAAPFREFIAEELIPYINQKYPSTDYRTLIGHSYAGLFTIHTMVHQPELFKNYIAIDPSVDWDNQHVIKEAAEKFKSEDFSGRSLFMSLAAEQLHIFDGSVTADNFREDTSEFTVFGRSIAEFADLVASTKAKSGLNFAWKIYPEELHGTAPLKTTIDGLQFVFNWFQFKNPQKYNNPNTTVAEIEQLLIAQEKIYTENYGYPAPPMVEDLFTGYGYMNMQMGSPEKAELFFKNGVKYYPKSPNTHDSYGEFLESQSKFKEALKHAEKAFELSGTDYHKERITTLKAKIED